MPVPLDPSVASPARRPGLSLPSGSAVQLFTTCYRRRIHRPGGRCIAGAGNASVDGLHTFDEIFARWIDAEARGDAVVLDALLDVDFRGDDPRGFVLTKQEWLDRYRDGDLVNGAFKWQDIHVRVHADTVYVRGIQSQEVCYRGEDWSGRFRATLMAVRQNGRWSIVNLQLSELEEPDPDESRP